MNNEVLNLYHYTSNEVLWNIAKYKTLRLTSLKQSNDHLEGKWIWEAFARPTFRNILMRRKIAGSDFRDLRRSIEGLSEALGFCLSAEGDLLSQWRGYADGGAGVSIGFDRHLLGELADQDDGIYLRKVTYDQDEQVQRLEAIFTELTDLAREIYPNGTHDRFWEMDIFFDTHFVDIIAELLLAVFEFKNPAFAEEIEWRLVRSIGFALPQRAIEYQPSGPQIKPFTPMSFGHIPELIASVTLGPKNQTPPNVISGMLKSFDLGDIHVRTSDASYR